MKQKKNSPKVKIHQKPKLRRKNSFWFDGHVATVTDDEITIDVMATGHINVCFNPNEKYFKDKQARKEAIKRGYTDKKINNIMPHDGWGNNNWFDFLVTVKGKEDEPRWSSLNVINFNDIISTAKDILEDVKLNRPL